MNRGCSGTANTSLITHLCTCPYNAATHEHNNVHDVQIITEPTSILIDCVCIEQNNVQPNQESNIRIGTNGIIIESWSMARSLSDVGNVT